MSKEYVKITLLEDIATPIYYSNAGTVRYWEVIEKYKDGDMLIKNSSGNALLWKDEIKAKKKIIKPNISIPTGMKLRLDFGYRRKWYGKYFK